MYTLNDLFARLIPPDAWMAWIPQSILDALPLDTRLGIGTLEDIWYAISPTGEILWSSAPIAFQNEVTNPIVTEIFAMLEKAEIPDEVVHFSSDPSDDTPPRAA